MRPMRWPIALMWLTTCPNPFPVPVYSTRLDVLFLAVLVNSGYLYQWISTNLTYQTFSKFIQHGVGFWLLEQRLHPRDTSTDPNIKQQAVQSPSSVVEGTKVRRWNHGNEPSRYPFLKGIVYYSGWSDNVSSHYWTHIYTSPQIVPILNSK